jgi:DNA processing protein
VNASGEDPLAAAWLEQDNHYRVALGDDDYPELLTQISDPPAILYIKGDPAALHLPALAIVGSRNPTSGGERNAFEFAQYLGKSGFCIVSGLAQGIDAAAHRGALAAGAKTVAFLGHGIDRIYPSANRDLAQAITASGAVVSEFPLGTPPMKELFPQRNRLISGLSLGTLVVEAARRSGSLITARLAGEQGREIFALPGSIHNPMARGCHRLIRDGAKLVESADDIIDELGALTGHILQSDTSATTLPAERPQDDPEYVKLRRHLSYDPASIDALAERSGLTPGEVSSMLLILELDGIVEKLSGGRYALQS